jgi:monovalent cation/hydrogen antiporter
MPEQVDSCDHLLNSPPTVPPHSSAGCEDCLREGTRWVHLRLCLACGHVGCCDSSPERHATRHFKHAGHPVIRSLEPGESWRWCYLDQVVG